MSINITKWYAEGETGLSSKTMAAVALGFKHSNNYPHDPADLNRCIKLVDVAPEVKEAFSKISALSKQWAEIIENWDLLREMFIAEAGYDWSKSKRAPETYGKMQQLFYPERTKP